MATLKELTPDPKNRRRHTSRNVDMVRESIEQVGTGRSIVIDEDDVVLAGNATVKAAGLAGLTKLKIVEAEGDEVIAVRRRGLSSEQKRALALYDNRTAELAEWDVEQLVEDVDAGLDLGAFFEPVELDELLPPPDVEGLTDPDAVPEPRATEIKRGDLFALGDHRVLCGDSTKAEDVARVMDGNSADAVVTDPPYNVGKAIANDSLSEIRFAEFHDGWVAVIPSSVGVLITFQSPQTFPVLLDSARGQGWRFGRMLWLWKPGTAFGVVPWHGWARRSEAVMVFERKAKWPEWVAYHPDMYEHQKGHGGAEESLGDEVVHPTVKPLWVVADLINHTIGRLYDPFAGSGTTIIAAEQLGRKCYAIEIEPSYCQVTIDRWEAFTGKTAAKC